MSVLTTKEKALVRLMTREGKGDMGESAQVDSSGIHKLVMVWVQIRKLRALGCQSRQN